MRRVSFRLSAERRSGWIRKTRSVTNWSVRKYKRADQSSGGIPQLMKRRWTGRTGRVESKRRKFPKMFERKLRFGLFLTLTIYPIQAWAQAPNPQAQEQK